MRLNPAAEVAGQGKPAMLGRLRFLADARGELAGPAPAIDT
jgi:hypothetical protein